MAVDRAESIRRGRGGRKQTQYFSPDRKANVRIDESIVGALEKLRADLQTKVLRSAAYAGAKLLADEMTMRAGAIADDGTIRDAIYTWHDDKQSGPLKQVYWVGVNKREASHWFSVEFGHWRRNVVIPGAAVKNPGKYGAAFKTDAKGRQVLVTKHKLPAPVWVEARPYIRPTADRMGDAIQAMKARLAERLREIASESGAVDSGAAQSVASVTA